MPKAKKITITFVCTGNTCRSPMAERLFMHAIDAENPIKDIINIQSAGVAAFDGSPASPNAVKALKDCKIELKDHQSQSLTQDLVDTSDIIVCMTRTHKDIVNLHFNVDNKKVLLMLEPLNPKKAKSVPDPFGGSLREYKECRDVIMEGVPALIKFIKKEVLK
jgi:protein-tyrosine phosphatase